jgi:hypothetical protein
VKDKVYRKVSKVQEIREQSPDLATQDQVQVEVQLRWMCVAVGRVRRVRRARRTWQHKAACRGHIDHAMIWQCASQSATSPTRANAGQVACTREQKRQLMRAGRGSQDDQKWGREQPPPPPPPPAERISKSGCDVKWVERMCQLVRVRESSKDADCEQRSITQQPQQMNLLLQCEQGRAAHGRQGRATARHVRCRQTHLEWVDNLELTRQSGEETRTRVEACDGRQRHHKILHAARTHKQGLVVE